MGVFSLAISGAIQKYREPGLRGDTIAANRKGEVERYFVYSNIATKA